jgi:hypothetical protein
MRAVLRNGMASVTGNVSPSVARNVTRNSAPMTVHRARKALAVTAAEVVRMPLRKSTVTSRTVRLRAIRPKPAAKQKDYRA